MSKNPYPAKITYIVQRELEDESWRDVSEKFDYLSDATLCMERHQGYNPKVYFRVVKKVLREEEHVHTMGKKPEANLTIDMLIEKLQKIKEQHGNLEVVSFHAAASVWRSAIVDVADKKVTIHPYKI